VSLEEYKRKRSFDKTPEPAGKEHASPQGLPKFCVQRHHATRLHYDLRLEVNGTLKSWAVPKGPSLDPSKKHLAMQTEDHPLEYLEWEGVIPKGNYGAGSMMLWDLGSYELLGDKSAEEQLARGDFKFRLHGQKVKGEFAIVRIKGSTKAAQEGREWLLIKKKDDVAEVGWDPEAHDRSVKTGRTQEEIARGMEAAILEPKKSKHRDLSKVKGAEKCPMPANVEPMKAVLGEPPPKQPDWIYEVKWDGVRAIVYLENGAMRFVSRRGNVMDRQYPELSVLPHQIDASTAILDGEIAALDDRGIPSFELLQRRITVSEPATIAALARQKPVVFYVFDVIYLDGWDLRCTPIEERKRLLKEIVKPADPLRLSEDFAGHGLELFQAAQQQGLEGIIAKRPGSLYDQRRSPDWVKYKVIKSEDFVICGFTAGERDYFGALVLGQYDGAKLVWSGNVGTGFDRKMMEHIHQLLLPLVIKQKQVDIEPRFAKGITWVRPEICCTVKFVQWTEEKRLRGPSFQGLRPDLEPADCVREGSVTQVARPPLLEPPAEKAQLTIEGRRLSFTNLNKVFYPNEGYTKRDLLNYYDAVADLLVPHLKDRPLSLKRYPNGIHSEFFFQKAAAESFPEWLRYEMAADKKHVLVEDRPSLLYLANLGCIDQNPWMSRIPTLEHPDFMLIDLDPQECPFSKIVEAALLVREKLEALGLEGYPKTTGGDGMHIYVPLEPVYSYDQVRSFAEVIAHLCIRARKELFTTPRSVAKRTKGKVYFDWMQIASGKTISAPYVPRAYDGAPVATPLAWREVTPSLDPKRFHIKNAPQRFARVGDLFEGVLTKPQRLEEAIERAPALLA
jgi:bifunctional non-homologous end joining protein LigD